MGAKARWGIGLAAIAVSLVTIGSVLSEDSPAPDLPSGVRLVKDGHSNIFVLPSGGGRVILIDCGTDPKARTVVQDLEQHGLSADAVEAIFITHGHPDHIGGCGAFKHAKLHALAPEVGLIEGTAKVKSPFRSITRPPLKATGLNIGQSLNDGDTISVGTQSIKVLGLPGHTPGSAAYLADQVLYVGDAASVTAKGTLRNAYWIVSTDSDQARRSLRATSGRLANDNAAVRIVAPAHGAPGPGTALSVFAG